MAAFFNNMKHLSFTNIICHSIPETVLFVVVFDYLGPLRWLSVQQSSTAFLTFYVEIYARSVLKTSSNEESQYYRRCFFLLQPRKCRHESDYMLSTTMTLGQSLLGIILCCISLVKKFPVAYDTVFFIRKWSLHLLCEIWMLHTFTKNDVI